jgi:hypothetical protein
MFRKGGAVCGWMTGGATRVGGPNVGVSERLVLEFGVLG